MVVFDAAKRSGKFDLQRRAGAKYDVCHRESTGAGAWGAQYEDRAVEYFMRSIQLCKELGNDVEIAKSYRAFAQYAKAAEELKGNEFSEVNIELTCSP